MNKLKDQIEKIINPDPYHRLILASETSYNVDKRLRDAILLLAEAIDKLNESHE